MSYIERVTIKDLYVALKQLLNAVIYPPNFDRSLNRTRQTAIVESGTITTVSTVSTVTNVTSLNNIDTYQGKVLVLNSNLGAWAQVVRARIS